MMIALYYLFHKTAVCDFVTEKAVLTGYNKSINKKKGCKKYVST